MKIVAGLLTGLNLFCGLAAIIFAVERDFIAAAWMILLGVLFDGLDGLAARFFSSASAFGRQFDSFTDIITFGAAPCVLAYTVLWGGGGEFITGLALFAYLLAGVIRLSYYCLSSSEETSLYFNGLPITVAGGFSAGLVYMSSQFRAPGFSGVISTLLCLVAFLMVSNVRYPNLRGITRRIKGRVFLVISVLTGFASVYILSSQAGVIAPEFGICVFFLMYIAFSPFLLREMV